MNDSASGNDPSPVVRLLATPRFVLLGGLALVVAASWAYLVWMARDMASMAERMGPMGAMACEDMGFTATLTMWVVMMAAMMLPTAVPMLLLHAGFQAGRAPRASAIPYSALFAAGYMVAWTFYAGLATGAQWGLESVALMNPMAMKLTSGPLAGTVLMVAGAFQLTSIKEACLAQCRSPLGFLMTEWREGLGGALSMGVRHGQYCVSCCWALMAVMFAVGTMNLFWMAALTVVMILEKVIPAAQLFSRVVGIVLILGGGWYFLP